MAAGPDPAERLQQLRGAHRQAFDDADRAARRAEAAGAAVTADATHIRTMLLDAWHTQRGAAATAARVLWAGPGRFGLHRGAYTRATQQLTAWAQVWRPLLPTMPTDPQLIAEVAGRSDHPLRPGEALTAVARTQAETAHPDHAALVAAVGVAEAAVDQAAAAVQAARRERDHRITRFGRLASLPDPAARLADLDCDLTTTRDELTAAQARIASLKAEPAYGNQPPDQLAADQHSDDHAGRRTYLDDRHPLRPGIPPRPAHEPSVGRPQREDLHRYQPHGRSRGLGR